MRQTSAGRKCVGMKNIKATQTSRGTFWNINKTAISKETVCHHDEQHDDTNVTWDILEQK